MGYQSHAGVKAQWRCNYASVSFVANAFPTTAAKRKALAKLGHCTALYGLGVQIADVEISSSKICESLRLRLTYRRVGRFPHGVDSPQSTERKRSLIQYSKPDAAASFLCVATSALRPGQTFDSISGRGRTPFARTGTISASRSATNQVLASLGTDWPAGGGHGGAYPQRSWLAPTAGNLVPAPCRAIAVHASDTAAALSRWYMLPFPPRRA